MKANQQRMRSAIVCLFLLVLPLFSMYFHGRLDRSQSLAESMLIRITAPGQDLINSGLYSLVAAWKRYVYLVEVEEQNEGLRKQMEDLKLLASRAKGLEIETQRLREMLEFKEQHKELVLASAKIIGRESTPQFSVARLRLDRGQDDTVQPNLPVLTATGLVGRIETVSGDYCDVMLLTDSRSNIDVELSDRGISGTLMGTGDGLPIFRFPYQKTTFKKGDPLLTTGHDRVFPKGHVAGYLASDTPKQVGQQLELPVEPAVRFPALQDAFIVLQHPDESLLPEEGSAP